MSRYWKAIVAAIGAAAAVVAVAAVPSSWRLAAQIVVGILTTAGVYQVKNAPAFPAAVPAPESSFSDAEAARLAARAAGVKPEDVPTAP